METKGLGGGPHRQLNAGRAKPSRLSDQLVPETDPLTY